MSWLSLRYGKRWYVVAVDEQGRAISSAGPMRWPRAQQLRDERLAWSEPNVTVIIRRKPGERQTA